MPLPVTVLNKGAGEMASGVAWRLWQSRFRVVMTEVNQPLAVRRAVDFCEAVYEGRKIVEMVEAVLIKDPEEVGNVWQESKIPVLADPQLKALPRLKPEVLVEATISKQNTGIAITNAPLVIALGPGYEAGRDAHLVVETNRRHHLGRLYTSGQAQPNTGVPGTMAGVDRERVLESLR